MNLTNHPYHLRQDYHCRQNNLIYPPGNLLPNFHEQTTADVDAQCVTPDHGGNVFFRGHELVGHGLGVRSVDGKRSSPRAHPFHLY